MGLAGKDYQCPGCAETIDVRSASRCPLCETPIIKVGGATCDNAILCRSCNSHVPLDSSACPHCGKTLASSGGLWILLPILFIFFIFGGGILAAIAVPSFQKGRVKAQQRACFANQKTIAGATEMYNLDFNTMIDNLNPAFFKILIKEGYLQRQPECPASRKHGTNYSMNSSSEVTCKEHGSVSAYRYQVEK